jgi:hypothetical protein
MGYDSERIMSGKPLSRSADVAEHVRGPAPDPADVLHQDTWLNEREVERARLKAAIQRVGYR